MSRQELLEAGLVGSIKRAGALFPQEEVSGLFSSQVGWERQEQHLVPARRRRRADGPGDLLHWSSKGRALPARLVEALLVFPRCPGILSNGP